MIFTILVILSTVASATYAIKSAFVLQLIHREIKPIMLAFFAMLAAAILEITLLLSPEIHGLSTYFIIVWFGVELLLILSISWMIALLRKPRK